MNFLVDETLISLGKCLTYAGFNTSRHNSQIKSTFDTFDVVKPNFYIMDINQLTKAKIKCMLERPYVKLCVVGRNNENINKLLTEMGDVFVQEATTEWGDLLTYRKVSPVKEYYSDFVAIEDKPEYCNIHLSVDYDNPSFRIFCPTYVRHPNYCGFLSEELRPQYYVSARSCICSEETKFNAILSGGHVAACDAVYEDVIQNHTSFDVMAAIFDKFDDKALSAHIKEQKEKLIRMNK